MNKIIKQKIDSIAKCFFAKIKEQNEQYYGLYSGEFGHLLFILYYSRFSKNENHIAITESYAERLLEQFIFAVKKHSFCDGLSGILYLIDFLQQNDVIEMNINEIQPILNNRLVSAMRIDIRENKYDFMHGALGTGLYFLKHCTNTEYIQELIDFLYNTAKINASNQIIKWKSIIDPEKNLTGYNLALSHGISSIIIFLARVTKSGYTDNRIMEMLNGAVNFVLSSQQDFSKYGSYFPNYFIDKGLNAKSKSRMAWCYGDLGIGIALWQAGKVVDNNGWKEKGLEVLLQSTKRKTYQESMVTDAGICHGSAGITLIFRRMYLETNLDDFKSATQYWIKQTLELARFEDGKEYKIFFKDRWVSDYSLLTGISGIGLVLLSYLHDEQQNWDEMLLIS